VRTVFTKVTALAGGVLLAGTVNVSAATLLLENFDDIGTLGAAGWSLQNNSSPLGSTGWFQGNAGVFPSQAGAPDAYIAANFENAAFGGTISNWLLTPELALSNGDTLSFYTRTVGSPFPDRLEVRLSTAGSSTNVGGNATSVGDFTTLLLTINPSLAVGGYPDAWTQFTLTLAGLGGPTSGRLAFRYFVDDTEVDGDYIGIDTVRYDTAAPVPEPMTLGLVGLGLVGLAARRRR
jgi:hypothetical protein